MARRQTRQWHWLTSATRRYPVRGFALESRGPKTRVLWPQNCGLSPRAVIVVNAFDDDEMCRRLSDVRMNTNATGWTFEHAFACRVGEGKCRILAKINRVFRTPAVLDRTARVRNDVVDRCLVKTHMVDTPSSWRCCSPAPRPRRRVRRRWRSDVPGRNGNRGQRRGEMRRFAFLYTLYGRARTK